MLNIPTFHHVVLLIDADNAQLSNLDQILKLVRHYGNLKICRAYGDWEKPPLSAFRDKVDILNIERVTVDRIGKDTTDKRLMIEASKILGRGDADLFIVVSADGDFRQLCEAIKEEGRQVIGIGNKKQTSPHLEKSCDTFHYIEDLEKTLIQLEKSPLLEFKVLLFDTLTEIPCDSEGWVNLGLLGKKLREDPTFKKRFNGKLSKWLNMLGNQIEIKDQSVRRRQNISSRRAKEIVKGQATK